MNVTYSAVGGGHPSVTALTFDLRMSLSRAFVVSFEAEYKNVRLRD